MQADITGAAEWLLLEGVGWSSPPVQRTSRALTTSDDAKIVDDGTVSGLQPYTSPWFWIPATLGDCSEAKLGNL